MNFPAADANYAWYAYKLEELTSDTTKEKIYNAKVILRFWRKHLYHRLVRMVIYLDDDQNVVFDHLADYHWSFLNVKLTVIGRGLLSMVWSDLETPETRQEVTCKTAIGWINNCEHWKSCYDKRGKLRDGALD